MRDFGVTPPRRRGDWRFLLPGARPPIERLVLLGGSPALAEWLLSSGIAKRVLTELDGGDMADAVVILDGVDVSPERVAAGLRPNASLYWEIERGARCWFARSPSKVLASLRRAGLAPRELFWVRPSFRRAQAYIPLERREALRWYWNSVFVPTGRRERLVAAAARMLDRLPGPALSPLITSFAVTASAGGEPKAASFFAGAALGTESHGEAWRPLLLTAGANELDRVILLAFEDGAPAPAAIFKCGRAAEWNDRTENEQQALRTIRPLLAPAMQATLPQPLGTFAWGDVTVGVETFLPGRSLSASMARRRSDPGALIEDLDLATTWLAEFHRQTQVARPTWNAEEESRWLGTALSRYDSAFGTSSSEAALFSKLRERSRSLAGLSLPIVWQHNSFGPWNLVRMGASLGVFDWEGAAVGLPLFDLLYFILQWGMRALPPRDDADRRRLFRELFGGASARNPIGSAANDVVDRYLATLQIDRGFGPILLVLLWVGHALGRYEAVRKSSPVQGSEARRGNQYVSLVETLAESSERLLS